MKKFLALALLSLCVVSSAFAGTAQVNALIGLGLPPELASQIDATYSSAIPASEIPSTDNTFDLGSASKQFRTLYTGTSIVNAGTTTTTGLSTLNGQLSLGTLETVAGAGTTVTDAAALSATTGFHQITGANGTLGWKFVTATPVKSIQFLLNTTAGVPKIYGESGSTCNGGATDAACTLVTGIVLHVCVKTAALTYICS